MGERIFLGIPILNRLDLLEECLDRIDVSAEILIINNNGQDREFTRGLRRLGRDRGLHIRDQERNLGVAGSWNRILMTGMGWGYDLVFIGSNDTLLWPGSLQAALEAPKEDEDVALWHIWYWSFFAMPLRTIPRVGWFDENFYPAYKEDQDYSYRCRLAGMRRHWLNNDEVGADHLGSQTIRSDAHYFQKNAESHGAWNTPYYRQKWGGDATHERFRRPFDKADRDHRWWPDPARAHAEWDWGRGQGG